MTELSNEKIAMLEIEQERMSLGKFFNPEDLKLENLPKLLFWLKENKNYHLASPREWLSRFLMESYKLLTTKEERLDFLKKIKKWIDDPATQVSLADSPTSDKEKNPEIIDTITATVERLERMEPVKEAWFGLGAEAIVMGGSLSYGPFHNVRKETSETKPSDIDTLIVIADPTKISPTDIKQKFLDMGASEDDAAKVVADWQTCWQDDNFDIFTNKLKVTGNDENYDVSFHIITASAYERLTDPNTPSTDTVSAFRTRPFKHKPIHTSLAGNKVPMQFSDKALGPNQHQLDMATHQKDERGDFVPNLYHNFILPNADVYLNPDKDTTGVKTQTDTFLEMVYNNLKLNSIAQSHIRSKIISPFLHFHLANRSL